jgi:hypothetical protein
LLSVKDVCLVIGGQEYGKKGRASIKIERIRTRRMETKQKEKEKVQRT